LAIERATFDTETRSHCDISRGLDVYVNHHTTQLVCAALETDRWKCAASFIPSSDGRDQVEAKMRDLGVTVVPPETLVAMLQTVQITVAHNFAFDQAVTRVLAHVDLPAERWSCTMARAMRHGLPGGLGNLCQVLGFGDEGKDKEGNRLMKQIMKPRPTWSKWHNTPPEQRTKLDPGPEWFEDADRIAREVLYCARDVSAAHRADKIVPELEPEERAIWLHIHDMNCRGIPVDLELINGAIAVSEQAMADVQRRIYEYTGGMVRSLKAPAQLSAWSQRYGYSMDSWNKEAVTELIADPRCPEPVKVVARARQEAARGSVAKYETAAEMVSPDGRLRHQLLYAGTSTLRLAGRGVQPLNLPRPKIEADKSAAQADIKAGRPIRIPEWKLNYDPERALDAIRRNDLTALRGIGDPEEILSDNIRAMIKAPSGKIITSPDLSAIEARGVFWVSGCEKALSVYRRNGDLYCEFASTVVGHPVNKKDHPELRQLYGKTPILSAGYGAGATRVATHNKIDEDVAARGIQAYRTEYHEVPAAWRDLEHAAKQAIFYPGHMTSACNGKVHFIFEAGWLKIRRPSGTWMYLPEAGVDYEGRLYYHSWIRGAWREESIWGGVLINFVVQGFCRELIYHSEMRLAQDPRFELFLQCYDSLSGLVDQERGQELCDVMIKEMTTPPAWAPDMPLAAEGKPKLRYS
jgi:DNA polymerase